MLVDSHRSYLSQFCLEVVAKHSLLQIPNWLDGSRGRWHQWENCTCSDEEDKEQGPCEPGGDRHQLGGGQEALIHLSNKNISWAGLSFLDNITNHHLHCTEYQKWQNRRDEERSSFSQSHFSEKTSQELRMLSRSLSDCKSLTINVSNSQLCH